MPDLLRLPFYTSSGTSRGVRPLRGR